MPRIDYQLGLRRLRQRLGRRHPHLAEALTLETQLTENLGRELVTGLSPTLETDRRDIVLRLNNFTLNVLGVGFTDLCKLDEAKELKFRELQAYFNQLRSKKMEHELLLLIQQKGKANQVVEVLSWAFRNLGEEECKHATTMMAVLLEDKAASVRTAKAGGDLIRTAKTVN